MEASADLLIRCPACKWEPDGLPLWHCACGNRWDVFATAGRCPECGLVQTHTRCLPRAGGCGVDSPHLDWYMGLGQAVDVMLDEAGDIPYWARYGDVR
jgi:hypothetical protein